MNDYKELKTECQEVLNLIMQLIQMNNETTMTQKQNQQNNHQQDQQNQVHQHYIKPAITEKWRTTSHPNGTHYTTDNMDEQVTDEEQENHHNEHNPIIKQ